MTKRDPPLSVAASRGLTVRSLQRLLSGAHPEAKIILLSGPYRCATAAELEVSPVGQGSKPIVIIK
jgi:hypothetical protein